MRALSLSRIEATVTDSLLRSSIGTLEEFEGKLDNLNVYPGLQRVGSTVKKLSITLSLVGDLALVLPLVSALRSLIAVRHLVLTNFTVSQLIDFLSALSHGGLQSLDVNFFNITPNSIDGLIHILDLDCMTNLQRWRLVGYKGDTGLTSIPGWCVFKDKCVMRNIVVLADDEL